MDEKIIQKEVDDQDLEDFNRDLDNMVDNGYVYALCPACMIPLDQAERRKHACNSCGPFDSKQVKYKHNDLHLC